MDPVIQQLLVSTLECPECGTRIDQATAADGSPAEMVVGDASVCCHCATVVTLDKGGFRKLSMEDFMALTMPEKIRLVLARMVIIRMLADDHG